MAQVRKQTIKIELPENGDVNPSQLNVVSIIENANAILRNAEIVQEGVKTMQNLMSAIQLNVEAIKQNAEATEENERAIKERAQIILKTVNAFNRIWADFKKNSKSINECLNVIQNNGNAPLIQKRKPQLSFSIYSSIFTFNNKNSTLLQYIIARMKSFDEKFHTDFVKGDKGSIVPCLKRLRDFLDWDENLMKYIDNHGKAALKDLVRIAKIPLNFAAHIRKFKDIPVVTVAEDDPDVIGDNLILTTKKVIDGLDCFEKILSIVSKFYPWKNEPHEQVPSLNYVESNESCESHTFEYLKSNDEQLHSASLDNIEETVKTILDDMNAEMCKVTEDAQLSHVKAITELKDFVPNLNKSNEILAFSERKDSENESKKCE